jgi:hypothetical protein
VKKNPRSVPDFKDPKWNAHREKLEKDLIKACLKLIEHTGSDTFKLPLADSDPQLFILCGDAQGIRSLTTDEPPRDH